MPNSEKYYKLKGLGRCVECERLLVAEEGVRCYNCTLKKRERRSRLSERRKSTGRCPACGSTSVKGKTMCDGCQEKHRADGRKRAKLFAEAGLCVQCGKSPPLTENMRCEPCRKANVDAQSGRRDRLIREGKCVRCMKPWVSDTRITCDECSAERSEYMTLIRNGRIERHECTRCGKSNPNWATARECPACVKKVREHYRNLVASGICVGCEKADAVPGEVKCEACKAYVRESSKKRYWSLKEQGLCVQCGKSPPLTENMRCEPCRKANVDAQSGRRDRLIREGKCVRCMKPWVSDTRITCDECSAERSEYMTLIRNGRIERHECTRCGKSNSNWATARECPACVERVREHYRKLVACGICVGCEKADAVPGEVKCEACKAYVRESSKKRYWSLKEQGLCVNCGIPTSGAVYCEDCAEKSRETNALIRQKRIDAGLCIFCAAPHSGETQMCRACTVKQCERAADRRASRKKQGLCVNCAEPHIAPPDTCPECTKSGAEQSKRHHEKKRSEGRCTKCGSALDTDSGWRCSKCLEIAARSKAERVKAPRLCSACGQVELAKGCRVCPACRVSYQPRAKTPLVCPACKSTELPEGRRLCDGCRKPTKGRRLGECMRCREMSLVNFKGVCRSCQDLISREKAALSARVERAKRTAAGMCSRCGQVAVPEGERQCADCRKSHVEWKTQIVEERKKSGVCVDCGGGLGGPADSDVRCGRCRAMSSERKRRHNDKQRLGV